MKNKFFYSQIADCDLYKLASVTRLPEVLPKARVALAIDCSNLDYGAKFYRTRFSYKRLLKLFTDKYRLLAADAYLIEPLPYQSDGRRDELRRLGYRVLTKPLEVKGGRLKGDMDVEICLGCVELLHKIDVLFLASGDSDFLPLMHYVQHRGVICNIIAFENSLAGDLKDRADAWTAISEDFLEPTTRTLHLARRSV